MRPEGASPTVALQTYFDSPWRLSELSGEPSATRVFAFRADTKPLDLGDPRNGLAHENAPFSALVASLERRYGGFDAGEANELRDLRPAYHARLSFSHTQKYLLVASCPTGSVGIDVESLDRRLFHADALAKSTLSAANYDEWRRIDPAQKNESLLRAWSQKEALLKAHGLSIYGRLNRLGVEMDPSRPPRLHRSDCPEIEPARVHLQNLERLAPSLAQCRLIVVLAQILEEGAASGN